MLQGMRLGLLFVSVEKKQAGDLLFEGKGSIEVLKRLGTENGM